MHVSRCMYTRADPSRLSHQKNDNGVTTIIMLSPHTKKSVSSWADAVRCRVLQYCVIRAAQSGIVLQCVLHCVPVRCSMLRVGWGLSYLTHPDLFYIPSVRAFSFFFPLKPNSENPEDVRAQLTETVQWARCGLMIRTHLHRLLIKQSNSAHESNLLITANK